jgi:hypothetical protein
LNPRPSDLYRTAPTNCPTPGQIPSEVRKLSELSAIRWNSGLNEAGLSTTAQGRTETEKQPYEYINSHARKENPMKKCRKEATRHPTSDLTFQTLANGRLKMEEDGIAKSVPNKKHRRAASVKVVFFITSRLLKSPFGFCGLNCCSVQSVQKVDWIRWNVGA